MIQLRMDKQSSEEISQWVEHLRTRSGHDIVHLLRKWHTHTPSVQGTWTPFTNKDTRTNIAEYPDEELSKFRYRGVTATEELLRLAREQGIAAALEDDFEEIQGSDSSQQVLQSPRS